MTIYEKYDAAEKALKTLRSSRSLPSFSRAAIRNASVPIVLEFVRANAKRFAAIQDGMLSELGEYC